MQNLYAYLGKGLCPLCLILSFLFFNRTVHGQEHCALPAADTAIAVQQPNGTQITLKMIGNPFFPYYETTDGYTVVKDAVDGFYKYAKTNKEGDLVPSSTRVTAGRSIASKAKSALGKIAKHLRYTGTTLKAKIKSHDDFYKTDDHNTHINTKQTAPIAKAPPVSTGTFKHLLLLIDYPDYPFKHDNPAFDNMMNQIGYNVNGQAGSFKEFYLDTSYGNFDVETTVVGWYTAEHDIAYYGFNPDGRFPFNAPELAREAVDAAAAAGVDFSQFDNDGDGRCDVVTIAHAGPGAETIGFESRYIWSHKSQLGALNVTYNDVLISDYTMNPELAGGENSTGINDIGVYVHEFGHALGLPDLYDFTTSNGAGRWCAMSWSSNQKTPIEFNPWFKEKLGWMSATVLDGSGSITNMGNTFEAANYYRINTNDPTEFYLLANMQKTKWHSRLPSSGLMIWHIDTGSRNNTNVDRLHVVPEQADGRQDLQQPYPSGNLWDAGDPYPGSSGNTEFNATSTPNTTTNIGIPVAMGVTNIREENGLISFDYSDGSQRMDQQLSFDTILDKTYGDPDFQLAAVSNSGLPVEYSVIEGPIAINGNTVTINGAGAATIAVNQNGDADHNAAMEQRRSFTILKADQSITIATIADKLTTDVPFDVIAQIDSNLELNYEITGPGTISGNTITLDGNAGTVTVTVSQLGTDNYNPSSESLVFQVSEPARLGQSIAFETIPNKTYGDPDFELSGSTTSGLPITYSVLDGPISINGNTVTINGAGPAIIGAEQEGDENYDAAENVQQAFSILKAGQNLILEEIANKLTTDTPFELMASIDSGLPLTYQIEGPASITESTITLAGLEGEVTVTISQEGNANYNPVSDQITFEVLLSLDPSNVRIFPNPTTGMVSIQSPRNIYVNIYNMEGKRMMTSTSATDTMDLSSFTQGIYILEGYDLNGNIVHKKVVKVE